MISMGCYGRSRICQRGHEERYEVRFHRCQESILEGRRQVLVDLCEEDDVKGMCGELVKAMYGTRDAAQNWEVTYVEFKAR